MASSSANGSEKVSMDLSKMKVPDLKKELKSRGLNTTGNKIDLIERLQIAIGGATAQTMPDVVDDLDEDLLNEEDDDDVPLEGTESVISDIDSALSESSTLLKRKVAENGTESKKEPPTKKLILNRTAPVIAETVVSTPKPIEKKERISSDTSETDSEKKVVKLSGLTTKERLDMRAKKFEAPVGSDAKKLARAERFGITSKTAAFDTKVETSVDVLKQRAERFGVSVSKVMSNIDLQDKLEKRKARFGIVTAEDKAKQRLERFKPEVK